MATTQYIGARYVPIFADPAEWNNTRTYEPLTIVMHEGNSYTSCQYVPKGIDILNEKFWALTGNYNAQVEQYRVETAQYKAIIDGTVIPAVNKNSEDIKTNASDIATVKNDIATVKSDYTKVHSIVAEMVSDATLTTGMTVLTLGYYSSNDDGGNSYSISETKSDRGLALDNGLYANPIENNKMFNIAKYGFVAGREFNGSDLADFASKLPYSSTIVIPKGVFNVSGPIQMPTNRINILGTELNLADQDRKVGTVLSFSNMQSGQTCLTMGSLNTYIRHVKISANAFEMTENRDNIGENVDVFTDNVSIENVVGLRLPSQSYGYEIEDVMVVRASSWAIVASYYNIINNVSIYQSRYGIICYNDCVLTNIRCVNVERAINMAGALTILDNLRCDSIRGDAVYVVANGCIINNVQVDYAQGSAIRLNACDNVQIANVTGRTGTKSPANKSTVATDSTSNTNVNGALIRIEGGSGCNNISVQGIFKQSNALDKASDFIVPKNFVILTGDGAHTVFINQGATTEYLTESNKANTKAVVNTINNANASFSGIVLGNFVSGKNNSFKKVTMEALTS